MNPKYLNSTKGFGLKPTTDTLSPYALAILPEHIINNLTKRTQLRYSLIVKDMMKMGCNKTFINDQMYNYVVGKAYRAFQIKTVKPKHLNDVMNDRSLDIRRSSPGIPWQPMYKTRGEVFDSSTARHSILKFWGRVRKGDKLQPPDCKVLYRAHLQKEDGTPKIRAVYGYPTTITVGEAQFALPLINGYLKDNTTPMAYGFDMATGGAHRLRKQISPYKCYGCFDFKDFDKNVSKQLITDAFKILLNNIDITAYEGWGTPDGFKILKQYKYIMNYFLNTPLRMPNGDRYMKFAGVPSGSYFTQMIDSIVNWILLNYAFLTRYNRMPEFIKVFGDDSVIADNQQFDKYAICKVLDEKCGMIINPQKCLYTTDVDEVEFLGFKITCGFPQRSFNKWVSLLANPEWPDQEWDDFATRAMGLFYANVGQNIEFDDLCRRICSAIPFRAKFSRSIMRLINILGLTQEDMKTPLPCQTEMLIRAMR